LNEHPSRAEISALLRGGLSPEREGEVLLHLILACNDCLAQAPAHIRALLKFEGEPALVAKDEADLDAAIDRAFKVALRHDRHLRRQQKDAKKVETILAQGGFEATERLPLGMEPLAKMLGLLARSWALRHEDPKLMVQLALLAVQCSERLDARRYGVEQVYDFKCRAQAELGNAYRVIDQFDRAKAVLGQARLSFELGTRNEILEVRLLSLEASLDADLRRFHAACVSLSKICRFHLDNGDEHLAGRALVQQGLYTNNAGNDVEALRLLTRSLELIDAQREPTLAYAARHNILMLLVDCGRFRDAERELFLLRPMQHHAGGRINQLRLRWEEARIDAGLGRSQRAEKALREISEGFLDVNRAFDSALASLDLAAVLLAQGKAGEATGVVDAACRIFVALRIEREALMAIVMLREACKTRMATRAMVEEVARFLRRFDNDPDARFEGKAWEKENG
jgi:tetratricopeptide (TPR) repeat protein